MDEQQRMAKEAWTKIGDEHLEFNARCDELIQTFGGDETDSRPAAFMRLRGVSRTIAKLPLQANLLLEHPDGVRAVMAVCGLREIEAVHPIVRDLDTFAKISFITFNTINLII